MSGKMKGNAAREVWQVDDSVWQIWESRAASVVSEARLKMERWARGVQGRPRALAAAFAN